MFLIKKLTISSEKDITKIMLKDGIDKIFINSDITFIAP